MRYFNLGLKKVYVPPRLLHTPAPLCALRRRRRHGVESNAQQQLQVDNSFEAGAGYYGRVSHPSRDRACACILRYGV